MFKEIRIENTNHCGYRCAMCPREKLTRRQGIMPPEDLSYILRQFHDFDGPIHLHGYGEPLLDPHLVEKVHLTRHIHPGSTLLFYTTLGTRIKKGLFQALGDAGLSQMIISCYGYNSASYKREHGVDTFVQVRANLLQLHQELPTSKSPFTPLLIGPDPEKINSFKEALELQAFSQWIETLGIGYIQKFPEHNFGSGRTYNPPPGQGICSIVWGRRKEILQITWDLKVIPCCLDFNASIVWGDLRTRTLAQIFSDDPYTTFIHAHQNNDLTRYPTCNNCERDFHP